MDGICITGTLIMKRERDRSHSICFQMKASHASGWYFNSQIINSYNNARGDQLVILSPYQGHSILVAVAPLPRGEVIQSFYSYLIFPFIHARFASGISASTETVFRQPHVLPSTDISLNNVFVSNLFIQNLVVTFHTFTACSSEGALCAAGVSLTPW